MINSLWLGSAAMSAQQLKVDTISNNLANVNTTGYKRGRVNFQELVYVTVPEWPGSNLGTQAQGAGATMPGGTQAVPTGPATLSVGTGTRALGVERLHSGGVLQSTGVETDLGLDGEGFFAIHTSSGETRYTRDGHFTFDAAGNLVTSAGESVVVEGGTPLPVGAKDLSIAQDGTITASVGGQAQPTNFGRVSLFHFGNAGGLEAMGQNLYRTTEASGPATAETATSSTKVRQGYLEASNVSLIDEMVGLMQAQRAYEMGAKIVQNADTLMAIANGLKR